MMRNLIRFKLSLLALLLHIVVGVRGQTEQTEVTNKLWEAIGGKENWDKARYFMFSCTGGEAHSFAQGERKYLWDKQTGNCRFEGVTTDDETVIALFNIRTAEGTVYINGEQLENPKTTRDVIKEATAEFEKDANLIFLPTALDGDQVSLSIAGEKLVGSQRFTVINIKNRKTSFESALEGQLYMDTQTGQVLQWRPSHEPDHFAISGFKDIGGGLVLPTHFAGSDAADSITYPLAAALVNIESQKFDKP